MAEWMKPLCLLTLVGCAACNESQSPNRPEQPLLDASPGDAAPMGDDWAFETCSWSSTRKDEAAECARVRVPADPDAPDAEPFELLIKRRKAREQPARAVMFLLAGGPGDSAVESADTLAHQVYMRVADIDLIAIDQRGTGGSERLSCARGAGGGEALVQCIEELKDKHGSHLPFMTTTHAARDLETVRAHLLAEGQAFYLYGGSYGTYLAQRYLSMFPDAPDAVVLEGVASPRKPFDGYDAGMEQIAEQLMEACEANPQCTRHFDGPPWAVAQATLQSLDKGHCQALDWSTSTARGLLGSLLVYSEVQNLIPATVARLARCNSEDQTALQTLRSTFEGLAADASSASDLLGLHVGLSELMTRPTDRERLASELSGYTMATGLEASLAALDGSWPTYEPDALEGTWSSYAGPLLILQGQLDPATPAQRATEVSAHYDAARQHAVFFPHAAHTVIGQTRTTEGADCATELFDAFLRAPQADLDRSCVQSVKPISFDAATDVVMYLFGTDDLWGEPEPT